MAFGKERGDDRLGQFRATAKEGLADEFEAFDLARRHHQIGQPDSREQHFAEGAGIKHPALAIEAFQGWQWAADIAVLAVVVVLDDPRLFAGRPFQQLQPARQRQRHA
ncbi:hypothetical protein D3C73_1322620 [compost metagenome]